jgi:hypothetical protein
MSRKSNKIKRVIHIARNFEEAEEWDIQQQLALTPDERLAASRELQRRVYGNDIMDVREWYWEQTRLKMKD